MASISTSTSFHSTFQSAKASINQALDSHDPPLSEITKSLSDLKAQLGESLASLPAYDQRSYELQLRDLETRVAALRSKSRPKSKFSFKKAPSSAPTAPSDIKSGKGDDVTGGSSDNLGIGDAGGQTGFTPGGPPTAGPSTSASLRIQDRSNERLTISDLDFPSGSMETHPQREAWTVSLEDLTDCIIDLRPRSGTTAGSLSSTHVRNLRRCIVVAGEIQGSMILHDLMDCIVLAAAQQFRIHTSKRCDISLDITSGPIIEACSDMIFRALPSASGLLETSGATERRETTEDAERPGAQKQSVATEPEPGAVVKTGVTVGNVNRVGEVADFSWVKSSPSPNWKYFPESLAADIMGMVNDPGSSAEAILSRSLATMQT